MGTKFYKVSEERLKQLELANDKLNLLKSYGVDNWHGYGLWYGDMTEEEIDNLLENYSDEEIRHYLQYNYKEVK